MDEIKLKGKNILITGGGGYLGSKLLERLLNSDTKYYILDKSFNYLSSSLAQKHNNIILCKADITDKVQVSEVCKQATPYYIFHFAALLDRSRDFSIYPQLYEVNVKGTLNLLEALLDIPYQGLYFSSTSEVYGTTNSVPFHEEQIPAPASPYSLTKLMAEQLIQTFSDIQHKPYTIMRIFNFYGPGLPDNTLIGQMMRAFRRQEVLKMTKGEQKRDFLYIEDLLDAIILIAGSRKNLKSVFNICSGKDISIRNIVDEFLCISGKKPDIEFGALSYRRNEIWELWGTNQKISNLTGWSVKTPLNIGLKSILDNLRK